MILIPGLLSGGDVWTTTVERYKAKVPAHAVTLVTDARHFIMFDAPDALWSAMDTVLATRVRAGSDKPAAPGGKR